MGGSVCIITHIATGTTLVWKRVEIFEGGKDKAMTEVAIAKQINSPYVVSILDYFVEDECLYIVMEFFKNGTLADFVENLKKSGKVIEEKVSFCSLHLFLFNSFICGNLIRFSCFFEKFLQIVLNVVKGVFALHGKKIMHRDLKPGNVFMTDDGQCKIGDFNLSKELDHSHGTASSFVGTVFFFLMSIFIS
jgi:serine/threonine protein kinase